MTTLVILIAAAIAQTEGDGDEFRAVADRYPDAARLLERAHPIPGLRSGFVPQGIAAIPERSIVVLSCYHDSGEQASVLAFVDADSGRLISTVSLTWNGRPMNGHVGGLSVCRDCLWSACEGDLLRMRIPGDDELEGLNDLEVDARYSVDSNAASLSSDGEMLWVGDFSHGRAYPTPEHHHRGELRAWVAAYAVDESGNLTSDDSYEVDGRPVLKPDRVVFVCRELQGFAVCNHVLALSTSYGWNDSRLVFHESPLKQDPIHVSLPEGHETEGFLVDGGSILDSVRLPAGAEDLEWTGTHLLLPFEGGADRYRSRWSLFGAQIEDRFYLLAPETRFAAAGTTRQVSVRADRENWTPAGLLLRTGQTLHVRADGEVTLQRNDLRRYPYVDANGQQGELRTLGRLEAPNGCLLVRIGDRIYAGGTDVTITAETGGVVQLGILENGRHDNNDGRFDVEITISPDSHGERP